MSLNRSHAGATSNAYTTSASPGHQSLKHRGRASCAFSIAIRPALGHDEYLLGSPQTAKQFRLGQDALKLLDAQHRPVGEPSGIDERNGGLSRVADLRVMEPARAKDRDPWRMTIRASKDRAFRGNWENPLTKAQFPPGSADPHIGSEWWRVLPRNCGGNSRVPTGGYRLGA